MILLIIQIVIAVLLVASILMQSQGAGLGGAFGGGGESYHTKRGIEKSLFYATIVLVVLFTAVSIFALI